MPCWIKLTMMQKKYQKKLKNKPNKILKPIFIGLSIVFIVLISKGLSAQSSLTPKMKAYYWVSKKVQQFNPDIDVDLITNRILDLSDRLLDGNYKLSTCILATESGFRNIIGDDGKSVGMGQLKISAAHDSCIFLGLNNCSQQHVSKLINNWFYNIELSIGYLSLLLNKANQNVTTVIQAYNRGLNAVNSGVKNFEYLKKVKSCMKAN